jgi:putative colanic acid biosynthesis UDP-glucose lipid carrier transferase
VARVSYPQSSYDVTTLDSEYVFLVKALFYPLLTVLFLLLCLRAGAHPISRVDVLIAVLAFAGVSEFIEVSALLGREAEQRKLHHFLDITVRWMLIGAGIAIILYLFDLSAALRDRLVLFWFFMTPPLLWSGAVILSALMHRGASRGQLRSAVIVGATEAGVLLGAMLENEPLLGIRSLGMFSSADDDRSIKDSQSVLGTLEDVASFVISHDVRVVYITLPMSRHPSLIALLKSLQNTTASVYFLPNYMPLGQVQARVDVVHGIPMIAVCGSPFYGVRGMVKRLSDITASSLALLMLSPLLVCIAVAIKVTSPGPAFFKQRRYGLDGREIMVYKFRSMSVTEDGATSYTQVTRNDSRVTPLGALLRRTSCDELPQLLNVLEGSMSIVGPRPHAVAVNEYYRGLIPSYMIRHKIKPGITGWAQVNGYRGGDDLPGMTKRIECDLYYVANWSLTLDLQIVMKTVTLPWRDVHAY